MTDLLVIGAGAAGLVCAGTAACAGQSVLLVEKMERPARKLMITGKGRCNVTNNCTREELIASVRTNPRFLYSAFSAFSAQDTMALLERLGIPLKTERGGRVFPKSDRAVDVVDALVRFAKDVGAVLRQGRCVRLLLEEGSVTGVELEGGERLYAKRVVLATGGKSYPLTGSDGDGYGLARQAGHTVTPLRASLIPIATREDWCKEAMGLSLRNVTLSLVHMPTGKTVYREIGEMLFTHFGVSGPLVLSASAHMQKEILQYALYIDLKPGLSAEQLDARLLRDFAENMNRDFFNSLGELLPRKLIPVVVKLSGIDGKTKVHDITREQRQRLGALIKALPLTPKVFRPIEEAVITAGGVSVKEVNPRTMESKLVKGLYFAGEILDVDAYTGGFNLQIAFSTAVLAAQANGL